MDVDRKVNFKPNQYVYGIGESNSETGQTSAPEVLKYQIIKKIGAGNFARIYSAMDIRGKKKVALKAYRSAEEFRIDFDNENNIKKIITEHIQKNKNKYKNNLNHLCLPIKNFCYADWVADPKHKSVRASFLHPINVFPCLGPDLDDLIGLFPDGFSFEITLKYTQQLLSGLCVLADLNIGHCDLKPMNILLKEPFVDNGSPKSLEHVTLVICDFGSSINFNTHKQKKHEVLDVGTCTYAPIELLIPTNYKVSPAADIWSLGCVIFEMLTGQYFFNTKNTDPDYSSDEDSADDANADDAKSANADDADENESAESTDNKSTDNNSTDDNSECSDDSEKSASADSTVDLLDIDSADNSSYDDSSSSNDSSASSESESSSDSSSIISYFIKVRNLTLGFYTILGPVDADVAKLNPAYYTKLGNIAGATNYISMYKTTNGGFAEVAEETNEPKKRTKLAQKLVKFKNTNIIKVILQRNYKIRRDDARIMSDILYKCLKYNPKDRISANDLNVEIEKQINKLRNNKK